MKILTVNAGSSSLKFNVIELPEEKELISGYFEKIGMNGGFYNIKIDGVKTKKEAEMSTHSDAIAILKEELIANHIVSSLDEIDGVGHRLVHGGDKYASSVMITDDVIQTVEDLSSLAPLHNPANLIGVRAFQEALPNTPMVGVFDTAFHQTMNEKEYLYPVPYSWYRDYKIRKYGFHGTSYHYITKRMKEILGKDQLNLIICHIGSGGSIACVKNNESIDTTMGFSPNSGIMMGTRSGDIDYSIISYYMKQTGKTMEEVDKILNKESGLLGISEKYSDHRDIEKGMEENDHLSILANDMYLQRVVDTIAKYYVRLNGEVDAVVFTAGIGENGREYRRDVIRNLSCLGMKIDDDVNMSIASYMDKHEGKISNDDSSVDVYVVPTNEELMIALDTYELINK